MKKSLLTAFIAIGIGVITSLQFAGADPIGVLFLKRVDTFLDNTRINQGQNNVLEFDIINGYGTDAVVSGVNYETLIGNSVNFSGSGFSFDDNITSLLIGAGQTRRVTTNLDVSSEEIRDIMFSIDGMSLVSGSGVYIDTGSGLSVDNSIDGAQFKVFPDNFGVKDAVDFSTPTTFNEDISLPIDFATGQFTFPSEITLEAAVAIPGVTEGLEVVIPAGTMISGSGSWYGELEAPEVLGLPGITSLPSSVTPQKRISVGVDGESLVFSSPVRISIPVSGSGVRRVYSSQNGVDWVDEGIECTITAGICSFEIGHFTEFMLTSIGNGNTIIGGYSGGHAGGGGQNTMRHGTYDPNKRESQGVVGITPEMASTVHNRSTKHRRKYVPCEINEADVLNNRFNNLRLLQGAPRVCKEDAGKYFDMPYKVGRR